MSLPYFHYLSGVALVGGDALKNPEDTFHFVQTEDFDPVKRKLCADHIHTFGATICQGHIPPVSPTRQVKDREVKRNSKVSLNRN